AGPRTLRGHVLWGLLALVVSWVVYTSTRTPDHVKWYWPFALALVVSLRAVGVGRARARPVLITGGCLLAAYLGGLGISARLAWRNVLRVHAPYAQISAFIKEPWSLAMRSPVLADPFRWQFFLQGERSYYIREVDIRGHVSRFDEVGPRALDDPRVREA